MFFPSSSSSFSSSRGLWRKSRVLPDCDSVFFLRMNEDINTPREAPIRSEAGIEIELTQETVFPAHPDVLQPLGNATELARCVLLNVCLRLEAFERASHVRILRDDRVDA